MMVYTRYYYEMLFDCGYTDKEYFIICEHYLRRLKSFITFVIHQTLFFKNV